MVGAGQCALRGGLAVVHTLAGWYSRKFWTLGLVYFASALPFFFAGTVVSLAISEAVARVDHAYFFDLAGAASGCLLLIPFLNLFGGPNTVIAAGAIYAVSAAIWFHQAGGYRRRATAVLVVPLLTGLMIVNGKAHLIDVRTAKGQPLPPERFVEWNSFSRVSVIHADVSWEPEAYWTVILDGDAGTGISPFDFSHALAPEAVRKLLYQGPGFPYVIRPGAKTLVIGPGGGYDIARALAGGSKDITGVEINPIIANTIMRNRMLPGKSWDLPQAGGADRGGNTDSQLCSQDSRAVSGGMQATLVDTLGLHRGWSVGRVVGKQSLYIRRVLRLSFSFNRRWSTGVYALGVRSAARIPSLGDAGDGCAEAVGRGTARASFSGDSRGLQPPAWLWGPGYGADFAQAFYRRGCNACARLCEAGGDGGAVPSRRSTGKRVSEIAGQSGPSSVSSRLRL